MTYLIRFDLNLFIKQFSRNKATAWCTIKRRKEIIYIFRRISSAILSSRWSPTLAADILSTTWLIRTRFYHPTICTRWCLFSLFWKTVSFKVRNIVLAAAPHASLILCSNHILPCDNNIYYSGVAVKPQIWHCLFCRSVMQTGLQS